MGVAFAKEHLKSLTLLAMSMGQVYTLLGFILHAFIDPCMVCVGFGRFVCLSVCPSVCLSVCLSVCSCISGTAGPIGLGFGLWVTHGPDMCMAEIQLSSFDLDLARGQK